MEKKLRGRSNQIIRALEYFELGSQAPLDSKIRKEYFNKAARIYKSILEKDAQDYEALSNYGGALSNMGEYKVALKYLDRAIKLDPEETLALENKAITLGKNNQKEEAIKYFDKVLKLNPNEKHSIINKWIVLDQLGKYDKKLTDKVIQVEPSFVDAVSTKAFFLFKERKYSRAFVLFKKAIHLDPTNAEHLNAVAVCYISLNKYTDALIFLKRGIKIDKNYFDLIFNMSLCYYKLKDYKKAYYYSNRGIILNKTEGFLWEILINSLINTCKYKLAIQRINDFVTLFPQHKTKVEGVKAKLLKLVNNGK